LVVAAQVLLEGHRLQHLAAIGQRNFLVGVPEETGVIEAGAEHAFVAEPDQIRSGLVGLGIEDGKEVRRQFAGSVLDGEILLVVAHDGHQNLLGKRQEFGVEAAHQNRRPLGQVGDRVDQCMIFAPAGAGDGSSDPVQFLADALATVLDLGQHVHRFESGQICRGLRDGQRGLAVQDAVTEGELGSTNPGKLDGNDLVIEHGQPAQRANESPGCRTPIIFFAQ
jgi:hypothetical protein